MIRILLDRAFDNEHHYIHAVGLSTDVKPTTGIITGSKFVAVDTGAGYLFDETAGEWMPSGVGGDVTDVQVNDTSVVQDGVANVPLADTGVFGVLMTAETSKIKAGDTNQRAITPYYNHVAAFYGLAKAAGADMKDIASTTVGIYHAAQKSAIQAMLGILDMIAPAEGAQASKAYSVGKAFCHAGALYKATSAIASGDAIVPGTNCEQTTIIDLIGG